MNPAVSKNSLVNVLGMTVAALAIVLLLEIVVLMILSGWSFDGPRQVEPDWDATLAVIAQLPPEQTFKEAIERSLFSWNRRPVSQDEQQSVNKGRILSRWSLLGIVDSGQAIYVIFSDDSGNQRLRLQEGMYLEKWKIESIAPDSVILQNGDKKEVFHLWDKDREPREKMAPDSDLQNAPVESSNFSGDEESDEENSEQK